jgi:hypothetical protein
MGVPGRTETDIVVGIAVPVVDVEAIIIEVANARNMTSKQAKARTYIVYFHLYHRKLRITIVLNDLRYLFSEFNFRALRLKSETSNRNKQEVPSLLFIARYRHP